MNLSSAVDCLDPYYERGVEVGKRKYPSVRAAVVSLGFEDGERLAEGGDLDLSTRKVARKLEKLTGNVYSSSGHIADAVQKNHSHLGLVPKKKKESDSALTLAVTSLTLLQNKNSFRIALQAGLRENPLRPASCSVSSLLTSLSERHSFCHCGTGRHAPEEEEDFSGEWVACDSCDRWFHLECTPLTSPPPEDKEWECGRCGDFPDLAPTLQATRRIVGQIRTSMRSEEPTLLPVKRDLSLLSTHILSTNP